MQKYLSFGWLSSYVTPCEEFERGVLLFIWPGSALRASICLVPSAVSKSRGHLSAAVSSLVKDKTVFQATAQCGRAGRCYAGTPHKTVKALSGSV